MSVHRRLNGVYVCRGAFQWGGGNKLRGWYLQPKHRDATRVAISFLVSTPATDREGRGALDTVEGCAVKRLLAHICDKETHPDTMVLTALTQFSCKVGHLFAPLVRHAIVQKIKKNRKALNSLFLRMSS